LTFTVNSAADVHDAQPGDGVCATAGAVCTLRAAIDESNVVVGGTDTINIAAGIAPVLSIAGQGDNENVSGDLDVLGSLIINGGNTSVTASQLDRVIDHHAGTLIVNNLTMTGGLLTSPSARGGGIRTASQTGPLSLSRSTVSNNQLTGAASNGGGLYVGFGSVATISRSTFSGNVAGDGAAGAGGGIYNASTSLTMTNSTVSGNTASTGAGLNGDATVLLSTFALNIGSTTIGGDITLGGSIISSGSTAACSSAMVSAGYNISFDASCALLSPTDLQSTSALLGSLRNNGGPTLTHNTAVASPARNSIPVGTAGLCDASVPTDQRNVARPQGVACDRGSVEQ
jgi:CSLREA domain-containing protein